MRRIAEIPEVPSGGGGGAGGCEFCERKERGSGGQIPLEKINLDFSEHSSRVFAAVKGRARILKLKLMLVGRAPLKIENETRLMGNLWL